MNKKFKKDLEMSSQAIDDAMDHIEDKDERIFINLYFIEKQLSVIKIVLVIGVIILFFILIK